MGMVACVVVECEYGDDGIVKGLTMDRFEKNVWLITDERAGAFDRWKLTGVAEDEEGHAKRQYILHHLVVHH